MNYYIYLIEIRNRMFLSFLTWLLVSFVCYFYKEIILFYILNLINSKHLKSFVFDYFIFTNITEIFQIYIKIIFFISNQILLIYCFYHLFIFLSSSLYFSEYKNFLFFIKILFYSLIISVLFLNMFIIPLSLNFFLSFQDTDLKSFSLFFEAKISEYINFYINLYYFCFISCVLSILFFIFAKFFSKNSIQIQKLRKFFYYSFFIISTLTTPPDVFSQILLSFLLINIYEVTIFLTLINNEIN